MKRFLLCLCALSAFASKANLITDTTNGSFVDTVTGLEWIDFGINNNQTFNQVSNQLGLGEEYYGWRLPTKEEALSMWAHVANLDGVEADYERPDRYGPGGLRGQDLNNNAMTESVFDDVFKMIGHNKYDPYGSGEKFSAYGFFEGTDGLSYVEFNNYTLHPGVPDWLLLNDSRNHDSVRDFEYASYSTLLVKSAAAATTDVPEPSSFALMFPLLLLFTAFNKRGGFARGIRLLKRK